MARPFVRVDLSDEARDFRPFALEPGVPMLDRSSANAKILFRWLGRLAAEPEWEGDSVNFYVRDDRGGRLEEGVCQPASEADLEGPLREELVGLKTRIEKAEPETATERAVKKMARRLFERLTDEPQRTDLDCYFFRYRDVQGRWRVVWCWGYQRADQEPAPARVCTDPECNLLFVRRPGQTHKCPGCDAALRQGAEEAARKGRSATAAGKGRWRRPAVVGLLLALFAAAGIYWYLYPHRLAADPEIYTGPVRSRVQFTVETADLLGLWKKDVSSQAVGVVLDPAVARFDQVAATATLAGPGETTILFHLGRLLAKARVCARVPKNPNELFIEPRNVELAIGTTARLKLIGQYEDGANVDLSDAAEWTAQNDGIVYAYDGLLEGVGEGTTTVTAGYRATPEAGQLEAAASVRVADVPLETLELGIDPLPVGVGRGSRLRIDAVSAEGKRFSVLESSRLTPDVQPKDVASVEGRYLKGRHAGQGRLAVTFNDRLSADMPFAVRRGPGLERLVVTPEKLKMVVGEIADLSVVSPSDAPIRMVSSDPAVVEVAAASRPGEMHVPDRTGRFIARSEGTARVEVTQGRQSEAVEVDVTAAEFASIAVDPARLTVPVDGTVRARVLARIEGDVPPVVRGDAPPGRREDRAVSSRMARRGRQIEIAPGLLECLRRPAPRYVDFDASSMQLRGIRPTEPSRPQALAFRLRGHEASAPVHVVVAPLRLELTPPGPIDLPLGQQIRLRGWATYSGGRRVQVPAGRLDLRSRRTAKTKPGLELRGDRVAALKPDAGPLEIYAEYFRHRSKPVVFRSVPPEELTLRLKTDRTTRLVGETGRVALAATRPGGGAQERPSDGAPGEVELVPDLAEYSSSDPDVLEVSEQTGALRAVAPGEVTVTGRHPAAARSFESGSARPPDGRVGHDDVRPGGGPATLRLRVYDQPVAVRILADQPQPVRLPVGAALDDFRVEAEYADGFTRLVTRQARLRTPEPPDQAVVTPSEGRLVAVRPGRTAVTAEFQGVASEQPPLQIEVTGQLDIDRISIVPSKMTLLPGETVPVDVLGYRRIAPESRASVGIITGLPGISFKSSDPQVARVEGRSVVGASVGQTSVTARWKGVEDAAAVHVVGSIAGPLVIEPEFMRIRAGQCVRVGTDLSVFRGLGAQQMDVSRQCGVTPAVPGVVRYVPEIHSLLGVAPGASAVAFTLGEKLTNAVIEVLPAAGPIDGEVIIEPSAGTLVPGQALGLRVLVVAPSVGDESAQPNGRAGERIDRTAAAVLSSSDPDAVQVQGNRACAVGPGTSEITATLPGTQAVGRAWLSVRDGQISHLIVEPPEAVLSTGDLLRLRILGVAATGTHEIFPQPGLTVTPGGRNPEAIQVVGSRDIRAVRTGQASVTVDWQNRLSQLLPVTVTDDPLGPLRIEPARAVIHPGQPLVYQVTATRGGQRRVLGPEDGAQLYVTDRDVARVIDHLAVCANGPGRTSVIARAGGQQAEARLEVIPGTGPGGGDVLVRAPGGIAYHGPGAGYWSSGGGGYWDDGSRYWDGQRWVYGGPAGGTHARHVHVAPTADAVGLRFTPEVLRLSTRSPPTGVRVFELLADGYLGREVTADPNLQLDQPGGVVAVEKTAGGPVLRPIGEGQARVTARLGDLTAHPLLVHVGEAVPRLARLVVAPQPLLLSPGQEGTFGSVTLEPGAGQGAFEIDYRVTPPAEQGVVDAAGQRMIRGLSEGVTEVVVTALDPTGVYDGLSTTATVRISSGHPLRIEPSVVSLQVGQLTPPLAVVARGPNGRSYPVPATLESMDGSVVSADARFADRFVARAPGATQIRAGYGGREAFADVTVAGNRFVEVHETLNGYADDFTVTLEVLTAESEGPLEYRVYRAGQSPPQRWVAAKPKGGSQPGVGPASKVSLQQVVLNSPRMKYGPPNSLYQLIIEARRPCEQSGQKYPFTFRLRPEIERADPPFGRASEASDRRTTKQ